jgi:Putative bacterial sensory transduction regulator
MYCRVGYLVMKKLMRMGAAVIAAGLMLSAAEAQTIDAVNADQLEAALDAAGLSPVMTEDVASGSPVATGSAGEFEFHVRAMACSGQPPACENLVFFANFPLGRTVTAQDYRVVNSFNDTQVFGRAYILESQGVVGVDYVIELGGGVTEDHLAQNVSRWSDVISAFVAKFQEGSSGS